MAFRLSGDLAHDTLTEQVWALCYCAGRGDVNKVKDYIHQEGLMQNSNHTVSSALMLATEQCHVKAVKTLIAAGADVNMSQSEHKNLTPLMTAAERGDVDCLAILMESGARINECRYDGHTPLSITIQEGCSNDVLGIVNAKSHVWVRSSMGSLEMIANRSLRELHEECALFLIQAGADIGYTNDSGYSLLMFAAANGSLKILKAIIQAGGNINQIANDGMTALSLACRCATILDFRLYKECVDLLLQADARVNVTNLDGKTPLILAVPNSSQYKEEFQRTDILQLLIMAGANLNMQDKDGKTALIYAAGRNLTNICEFFINNLADAHIQDNGGKTAYMYISDHRCLQAILSRKVGVATSKLKYKEYDQIYSQLGTDLNIQDKHGKTALIYAAQSNLASCCKLLINHYCDMNLQDNDGRTALMYTSKLDCMQALVTAPTIDGISFLPLIVVNPNNQDNSGKTALMYAAEHNLESCCQILISHFANVDIQDNDEKTALMYASEWYSLEILLSNGAKTDLLDNSKCSAMVYLLKTWKQSSACLNNVSLLLEYGADPVLDPAHRNLMKPMSVDLIKSLIINNQRQLIRLFVCNGFVTHFEQSRNATSYFSALSTALGVGHIDIAKYLISSCFLCKYDISDILTLVFTARQWHNITFFGDLDNSMETQLFLQQIFIQPWPLVKLAFIAVSSALGGGPAREQRITQTQLPPRLQRMLMFQEPVSRLPVSEWSNIPLCFDPVEYERLPKPRPLLYYWPFGRDLVI